MISVIVPVFNCEQYIDKCITSITNQDEKDFELIIVNDGSSDGTSDICNMWKEKDSRIVLICQENQGQGSARNAGIKIARGEYMVFVDADDFLEPRALSLLTEYTKHNDNDIVMYHYYYMNDEMEEKIKCKLSIDFTTKYDIMIDTTSFLWDKMFKRTFFLQNIILENHYGEDLIACAYLFARTNKIGMIDEILYNHVDRTGNLTSDHNRVLEIVDSLYAMVDLFRRNNMLKEYYDILLYLSYKQYRLYLFDLKYRFESNVHKKLINGFIEYFKTEYSTEINIIHLPEIKSRRYINIGNHLLAKDELWSHWGNWRSIEHYMINPYLLQRENEIHPVMTDYYLSFSRELDSIKYGTINQELWMDRWKKQCSSFLETLRQSSFTGNFIIIKQYLNNERLDLLLTWCYDYFAEQCSNVIICDEIKTRVDFLKAMSDSRLTYDDFDGFEKARTICQAEMYFRGEYFRSSINLNVMNMMLRISNSKRKFTEYFQDHNINSIAVYGMGYLGERFVEALAQEGFDIKFGIDKTVTIHSLIRIVKPEEEFEDTDAIVVTPVHLFEEIKAVLEYKLTCVLVSLEEVMEYFID